MNVVGGGKDECVGDKCYDNSGFETSMSCCTHGDCYVYGADPGTMECKWNVDIN